MSFTLQKTLRSEELKRALTNYVVPPFGNRYQIIAVRALWKVEELEKQGIWAKRLMEAILSKKKEIVSFISCITALEPEKKKRQKKRKRPTIDEASSEEETESSDEEDDRNIRPGLSFWVVADWPEFALEAIEQNLTKIILENGFDINQCKGIKPRGKKMLLIQLTL